MFISHSSTHDFTEIARLTLRVLLQDDSRGFLLLMGSEWQLCMHVCVCAVAAKHTRHHHTVHTAHHWGCTSSLCSDRPSPWCHCQWNEKTQRKETRSESRHLSAQLRKKEKEVGKYRRPITDQSKLSLQLLWRPLCYHKVTAALHCDWLRWEKLRGSAEPLRFFLWLHQRLRWPAPLVDHRDCS